MRIPYGMHLLWINITSVLLCWCLQTQGSGSLFTNAQNAQHSHRSSGPSTIILNEFEHKQKLQRHYMYWMESPEKLEAASNGNEAITDSEATLLSSLLSSVSATFASGSGVSYEVESQRPNADHTEKTEGDIASMLETRNHAVENNQEARVVLPPIDNESIWSLRTWQWLLGTILAFWGLALAAGGGIGGGGMLVSIPLCRFFDIDRTTSLVAYT